MLQNLLGALGNQFGNYQPTQNENSALNQITANAQNMPNYGAQANAMAGSYLGGDPTGLLSPALQQYQAQLNPYASGANLDPTKAPGMDAVLSTIRNDVGNSVNQQRILNDKLGQLIENSVNQQRIINDKLSELIVMYGGSPRDRDEEW